MTWPQALVVIVLGLPFSILVACVLGLLFMKLWFWWEDRSVFSRRVSEMLKKQMEKP